MLFQWHTSFCLLYLFSFDLHLYIRFFFFLNFHQLCSVLCVEIWAGLMDSPVEPHSGMDAAPWLDHVHCPIHCRYLICSRYFISISLFHIHCRYLICSSNFTLYFTVPYTLQVLYMQQLLCFYFTLLYTPQVS